MRILVAIVHHWNPEGGGRHQSLRPNCAPRVEALQQLILAFSRIGQNQFHMHFDDQAAYPANTSLNHKIDLHLITDGVHHVLEHLQPAFREGVEHVATSPSHPLMLGFEAQDHLASRLQDNYDLYAYFEDDLIVNDPLFFYKIKYFADHVGNNSIILPQRFEQMSIPARIGKLYIDGSLTDTEEELQRIYINPAAPLEINDYFFGALSFEAPRNPHAGCFVLTHGQLTHWVAQPWWLDRDCSFVSPLESAATLGLLKTFCLYKPSFSIAGWLEVQHWGTSFLGLMAPGKCNSKNLNE